MLSIHGEDLPGLFFQQSPCLFRLHNFHILAERQKMENGPFTELISKPDLQGAVVQDFDVLFRKFIIDFVGDLRVIL